LWIEEDLDVSFPEPLAGDPAVNMIQMAANFTTSRTAGLYFPIRSVKVKINVTLEHATKSQKRSTGIDLLSL
jgi:hypothetical protein